LEGLARFLLRSEAIASSRIEGLQVSPQQVGLAELADEEDLTADNMVLLQGLLLADEPQLRGLRDVQNWIGGSNHQPLDADFVPPPPDEVPALMGDLVAYMSTGEHAPLVHAGLVDAQFETVHPCRDGNGRVGRALVHTVLVRRGVTRPAVLPVSPVLLTRSSEYVDGLTAYRYSGDPVRSAPTSSCARCSSAGRRCAPMSTSAPRTPPRHSGFRQRRPTSPSSSTARTWRGW